MSTQLKDRFAADAPLSAALNSATHALAHENGEERELEATNLEVAVLERDRQHRKFRRIHGSRLASLIAEGKRGTAENASGDGNSTEDEADE